MSNHFGNISTGDEKITPKSIRSKHRLRLMIRLSEKEETVSKLADLVDLRVPHASAEIRKMRDEGLVSSDLITGTRGAKISLTPLGWNSLYSDEWARALIALPLPKDTKKYSIIYREGTDILFTFLNRPKDPMIMIPDRLPDSSGNEGALWHWATLNEGSLRWFNLDTMEISNVEPKNLNPESIDSYIEKPKIIGIIRGKILNDKVTTSSSMGKWFNAPKEKPRSPLTESSYHRGIWTLGECHGMIPGIRPKEPIVGILTDSLYKSMLLRTAKPNALLIGDLRGLEPEDTAYPLDSLDYWIELSHPRISIQERKKRLVALKDKITKNRRIRVSDSTWRKFRKDWGASNFSKDEYSKNIDVRGIKKNSIESLIYWSIKHESKMPLVLDIKTDLSERTLSLIESHPNVRLIIIEKQISQFESYDKLDIGQFRPLPWLNYSTKEGEIPLKLIESKYQNNQDDLINKISISPWKIMGIDIKNEFIPQDLDDEYFSIIKSSISQYPLGDEEWANQVEARYPLASWISSPPIMRWPRWQRLRNRLDPEWLALLDLNYLPIEKVIEVANEAPSSVLKILSEAMRKKLREDPDIFLRSRPAIDSIDASKGVSWLAAQFLANAAWMPDSMHEDMRDWAINAWIMNPPLNSLPAIKGIYWLYMREFQQRSTADQMMIKLKNKNLTLNPNNEFMIWSNMIDLILEEKKLSREDLELILLEMPIDWWAIVSHKLLKEALNSDKMKWLLKMDLPWSAVILRPEGERNNAPGVSAMLHPGCDYSIIKDLTKEKNNFESDSVIDLYEALNCSINNIIPKRGRSHELVGWLAQPIGRWPNFSKNEIANGNSEIMNRLIIRSSGFNK